MPRISLMAAAALAFLLGVPAALAHQPEIVDSAGPVEVTAPEISKAYYAELAGEPAEYVIDAAETFDLYAGLTVADIPGAETDFTLEVLSEWEQMFFADGAAHEWTVFHEEFAGDYYLEGPEYRLADAPAGRYSVRVASPDNLGKYVLAIGEIEQFGPAATLDAYRTVPRLKSDYFGKTGWSFAASYLGGPLVVLTVLFGALLGLLNRRLFGRLPASQGKPSLHARNIGLKDRLLRFGLALFLLAVGLHFWSLPLMVAAGYVLYEAAAKWCVVHAALGRNTCPIS